MLSPNAVVAGKTARSGKGDATPSLLELFSPISATALAPPHAIVVPGQALLWSADALHRANNLSQIITSLGRVATRHSTEFPADIQQRADALALCYAELGEDGEASTLVPCTRLLRQVASGLNALFGAKPGLIDLRFVTDPLSLPREKRRALILIASELTINALKYAFPAGAAGEIVVSLHTHGEWVELTIQDDGIGLSQTNAPGGGSPIIDALAALLGGTIDRSSPDCGLRVRLSFRQ